MRLGSLIEELGVEVGGNTGLDTSVTGFAIDNRKVAPGTIFGAFQGLRVNGEDFIADAVKAGAVAIVARPEAKVEGAVVGAGTVLRVEPGRRQVIIDLGRSEAVLPGSEQVRPEHYRVGQRLPRRNLPPSSRADRKVQRRIGPRTANRRLRHRNAQRRERGGTLRGACEAALQCVEHA